MNGLSDDPAVRLAECRSERNQCDGCQAGIPVEIGRLGGLMHRMGKPGGYEDRMSCTAHMYAAPAFDEAAERVKFEALCESKGLEYDRYTQYAGEYAGPYTIPRREHEWQGWLACAKSRAEVK